MGRHRRFNLDYGDIFMPKTVNIGNQVFSPPEVALLTTDLVKQYQSGAIKDAITTGIPDIDSQMLPFLPGELTMVLAFTSHGKTSFMNYLARQAVAKCAEGEVIVKCTWEQSVEEDALYWISHHSMIPMGTLVRGIDQNEWDKFMDAYSVRAQTPMWVVGHSSMRSQKEKKIRPRLTMTDIMLACEYIMTHATDNSFRIRAVFLDYLQRIRPDPSDGSNKREQMIEAVNKAKDLAVALGCPVIMGTQASRDILDRDYKQPRIDDGAESSEIERASQKLISLWYPIKTENPGTKVDGIQVTKNFMMFACLKQTLGDAPWQVPLYFNPESNDFRAMSIPKF